MLKRCDESRIRHYKAVHLNRLLNDEVAFVLIEFADQILCKLIAFQREQFGKICQSAHDPLVSPYLLRNANQTYQLRNQISLQFVLDLLPLLNLILDANDNL